MRLPPLAQRRIRLLEETFPDPRLDSAPVTPASRPPRERITVTAPQWELLVHADGQRTPADLAQLLGRAGYATILQLRRLAAAGLLELPENPNPISDTPDFVRLKRGRGASVDVRRPTVTVPTAAVAVARSPVKAMAAAGDPPRLARRKPGAKLPKGVAAEPGPRDGPGTDDALLKRIRTALRAMR